MSFEDEWLDLNVIYQNMKAENEDLRALIADYDAFAYRLIGLCNIGIDSPLEGLDAWLDMLRTRKRELTREEHKP